MNSAVGGLARLGIFGVLAAGVVLLVGYVYNKQQQREEALHEGSDRSHDANQTSESRIRRKRNEPYILNIHKTCPICLDEFEERDDLEPGQRRALIPTCGHIFHLDCISNLRNSGCRRCPICRQAFD